MPASSDEEGGTEESVGQLMDALEKDILALREALHAVSGSGAVDNHQSERAVTQAYAACCSRLQQLNARLRASFTHEEWLRGVEEEAGRDEAAETDTDWAARRLALDAAWARMRAVATLTPSHPPR
ncbi:hypothetical protein CDCA_CDCA05G1464 [Cyanidium caldarium]|uniref:Mediator of RNA polymerase II transcription subunit 11 n=1 Tax=Cyanidium caldarium TaxID=2771 RepID=A0AAV9IT14_CYACA|nr:hypothetical protein CDCA_CDCA05G1464 [Cyanidium caldarium]|eukprot:ctg_3534.g597